MKRGSRRIAFVTLFLCVALAPILAGEGETEGLAPTIDAVRTLLGEPGAGHDEALEHVVHFLDLRPGQIDAFLELLELRHEAIEPLFHEIIAREELLGRLLGAHPRPFRVGVVLLEIHRLHRQVEEHQGNFLAEFEGILEPEQRERLDAMRLAAELEPLLPAFGALGLI